MFVKHCCTTYLIDLAQVQTGYEISKLGLALSGEEDLLIDGGKKQKL